MEGNRRSRFHFRIRTIVLAIAIIALLLVVAIQQIQVGRQRAEIERLRKVLDSEMVKTDQLTGILREQRDLIERGRRVEPSSSQP